MRPSQGKPGSGASQWPAFAVLGLAHLGALIWVFSGVALPARMSAGSKASILIFILFWTAAETLLLTLFGMLLDRVTGGRFERLLDAFKGLLLGGLAATLAASYTKLRLSGLHLSSIDLRFAAHSLAQLQQEATGTERLFGLIFIAGALASALIFYLLLRALRDRSFAARPAAVGILLIASLAGAALLAFTRPPVAVFGQRCVAELAWISRSETPIEAGRKIALASRREALSGPRIQPYEPDVYGEPPNVVLIMLESLPWKRTSFGGGPVEAMPEINSLGEESVVFSRAYTAATHSDYAQMAILSSLFPRKYEGHDFYTRLDYPRTLIWDALHAAGYRTSVFSCQNETWGNMAAFEHTPGLDVFRDSNAFPEAPHKGTGLESKVYEATIVDAWRKWLLDERASPTAPPFFTYMNFQADHFPYEIPGDAPHPFAPYALDFPYSYLSYPKARIPDMLNRFYNALHYADNAVGQVVETLKERSLWQNTLLVVVSDHGEAFYEHGLPTHGTTLHEEQVHSLLLMHIPGEPPRRIDQPVSLLDIAPTLLRVLHLSPNGNFQGRGDILDPKYSAKDRPLFFTIQGLTDADGLLLDEHKYAVDWQRHLRELYDLRTDPGEKTNLISTDPETAQKLDTVLRQFLGRQLAYYGIQGWKQGRYPPPAF